MFDEPKHWKWMIPGMVTVALLYVWIKSWSDWNLNDAAMIPFGFMVIFGIATVVNLWKRVADDWANTWVSIRVAMNSTPEVRMFEAARGMHPDAVKALLMHRRTLWRIKYIPQKDMTDWVYEEAPTVHAGFVDYVLDNSNGSIMSKRLLSEGSKSFDPEGIVTNYQQYDDLIALMQRKLMITAAYGNQTPKMIPPWTVETIRHWFGLDGAAYEVDEEISDAMKAVIAEQKKTGWSEGNAVAIDPKAGHPEFIQKTLEDLKPLTSNQTN